MITHVAIKDIHGTVWSLPKPNRHAHIFLKNKEQGIDNIPLRQGTQGFLKDNEIFLRRKPAYHEAKICNQLKDPKRNLASYGNVELYSEDIW